MSNAAASRGRGIWHDGDAGALKQISQPVFRNVPEEFDPWISGTLLPHGLRVAAGLRMVSASDYEFGLRQLCRDQIKRLNHEFETFIRPPFAKGQNAVDGIPAP